MRLHNEEMRVRNKKAAARLLDNDAAAAFGLILGIIVGSALLNVDGSGSVRSAFGRLSAIVQTVTADFYPGGS
jgi:hypothetical protein